MPSTSEILQETVRPFFLIPQTRNSRRWLEFRMSLFTGQSELTDGTVYDLRWIPQTIQDKHGPDNTVGSTRTTIIGTDVGFYTWVEEVNPRNPLRQMRANFLAHRSITLPYS